MPGGFLLANVPAIDDGVAGVNMQPAAGGALSQRETMSIHAGVDMPQPISLKAMSGVMPPAHLPM